MNTVELLDDLYGARDVITQLVIDASPGQGANSPDQSTLQSLLQKRDQITWTIEQIIGADLDATMADYEKACQQIESATAELKTLKTTADGIKTGIDLASQIVTAAGAILATATAS